MYEAEILVLQILRAVFFFLSGVVPEELRSSVSVRSLFIATALTESHRIEFEIGGILKLEIPYNI